MKKYEGKVAIVTGSSRGIGKAIALQLAQQGASIVLNGRDLERLNQTASEIIPFNTPIEVVCADVSNTEGAQELIRCTINRFGRIDMLINNVGISMRGNFSDLNPEVFKIVFESNVLGTVYPTIPAIEHLRKTKGSIVFISSLAGIRGLPALSAYCSSKMALRAIAESIRIEEAQHNVHVGLIYVGITDIEHNKETIAADGSMKVLASRKAKKVQSTHAVAKSVLKNIERRKFISVLTRIGKINHYLQPRFPQLVEKIILRNLDKFEENSK
jgi:NAD(P)-dependent dehydrogenase (short-subunit alcohol dehydrogenase family)